MKRLLSAFVIMMFCYLFIGCNSSDEFAEYKSEAKAALQAYAEANWSANYGDENWRAIQKIVDEAKSAINNANSKTEVDAARAEAEAGIDAVNVKLPEIIREKSRASWWDGKVEVSLDFPREVKQGETFTVVITTKNITDAEIRYTSGSCCQNMGVLITMIKLQSEENYTMKHNHFFAHNEDVVETVIPAGGSLVATWEITTTHPENFSSGVAPKGIYDIYLSNGEALRKAIIVI